MGRGLQRSTTVVERLTTVVIVIFSLSLAFDFKGEEGGSAAQAVMLGINAIAFLALFCLSGFTLPKRGWAALAVWLWVFFLGVASVAAIANEVPFGQYLRVFYAHFLFLEGLLVSWWATRNNKLPLLIEALILGAVCSMFFTWWYGYQISAEKAEVRYLIVSLLMIFVITSAASRIIIFKSSYISSVFLALIAFYILFVSLTRGLILAIAFSVMVYSIIHCWIILKRRLISNRRFFLVYVYGMLGIALALIVLLMLFPDKWFSWMGRIEGEGSSVTFWTRLAAVVGQIEFLKSGITETLFGSGFGSSYGYSQSFATRILPYFSYEAFLQKIWYPGEFMWVTPLFYGGVIGGIAALIALISGMFRSITLLSFLMRRDLLSNRTNQYYWLAAIGAIGLYGLTFTANPFIVRNAALYLGALAGVSLSASKFLVAGTEK